MNHLLDHDLDQELQQSESGQDREISLGPGTILGIFFGLALLCGAVFGLGYSMGRHSAQNAPPAIIIPNGSAAPLSSASKPAAGFTASAPPEPAPDSKRSEPGTTTSKPLVAPADTIIAGDRPPKAVPPSSPSGSFMVQVAAVSTQEIADIELAALKKFGYQVVVRHEPTDQLLHIQIGPFATKKEAEAMRQNVLSHGFNAIVK